jgi:hypothetical protein
VIRVETVEHAGHDIYGEPAGPLVPVVREIREEWTTRAADLPTAQILTPNEADAPIGDAE